jgi:hypothetical protein
MLSPSPVYVSELHLLSKSSPVLLNSILTCMFLENSVLLIFIHFFHQWFFLGPGLFFSSVIFFTQTVGFLGRVISPLQCRYLHTGQHKHRINASTNINAFEWDWNPRSQRPNDGRQFMAETARLL